MLTPYAPQVRVLICRWHGKVVGENRRLIPGRGRITVNREYKEFRESLAASFTVAKAAQMCGITLERPAVAIYTVLGAQADGQNIIKPVCDALQDAHVVRNDRDIVLVQCWPQAAHKRGELDALLVMAWEA